MPSGSPGFSRWNACRDSDILPGTPDPAEAGTPVQRSEWMCGLQPSRFDSPPRNSCHMQDLRGACLSGTFHPMKARFACGSMVHVLSFAQKCCTKCNIFVQKHGIFRPAGGAIPRQNPGSPAACRHWPFAVFAHVAAFVVQTSTA